MQKIIKNLLEITLPAIVFLASFLCNSLVADVKEGKNILIINSYNSEFVWTQDQDKGFIDEVKKHDPSIRFFCEYLDSKRIEVAAHREEFARLLGAKYKDMPISIIYATDDIALEFAQTFAGQIGMGNAEIVASGINNPNNLVSALHPTTIGIHEVQSAKEIVELALTQNPKTNKIVIICDATEVGQDIGNDIDTQACTISDIPIERIPNMSWYETLAYIGKFDRNTLLLLGLYSVDKDGHYIQPYDVASQISQRAKAPVYAFHDIFTISPDVVGGYVNSGIDQGKMAGKLAVRTIQGRSVGRQNQIEKPGFTWVFNYGAMKRFGISESTLPKGSKLYGKPENFIADHIGWFITVVVGVASQTLLILFLLLNIRRRNSATVALQQSEARLRLLLENSPLAVFISDRDGTIVLLNSQFRTMLGYNASDMKTLSRMRKLLMPDPVYREKIMERMEANSKFAAANGIPPMPIEYVAKAKDGHNVEVEMYYAEAGNMLFRVLHDVTERNRVMRELRQVSIAATAASEAKSRFIANVSHEIRTPMNGILGMVQLLHETQISVDQRDYIDTIGDSCSLLLTVINDILDLSRIEAGQMKLLLEPVRLDSFLKSVVGISGPAIEARGLEFICNFSNPLPETILCDPNRVKQVLLNLLINASKFTNKGHVEFKLMATQITDKKCVIHFEVADTGIGISTDVQDKIFEPFMQADSSQTRKVGGNGLGLAISKKLVQIMGGEISFTSDPGVGTTFKFDFPAEIAPSSSVRTNSEERIDTNTAKDYPLSILVAEDNAVNQKVVGMMLSKMGYTHDITANGIEAVEAATRNRYDIILMDIQMPLLDGITAASRIRKMLAPEEQPQIYALTAHAMNDDMQRCLDAGMNGHLTKPLKMSALRDALVNAYAEIHAAENTHKQTIKGGRE